MENKFSKFINLQGKYLTSLLILLALSIGQMWGAVTTEVYDASGASSSVTMTKTGSTLAGTYVAGQGGGAISGYTPSNKGVKLRTQTTKVTVSETEYGYAVITANSGYVLKSFKIEGTSNGSNSIDLLGVYVDVDATSASTLATALATATNQLSSKVTIPDKSTTYVSSPNLSINASSNIVMLFPGSGDNQMRAIITIGYEEASSGIPCTDATVSFAATSDAIEIGSGESSASTSLTFLSDNASTASYSVTKGGAATADASVAGTTFTATAAGEYVVTVTQAKDETNNICAVEETVTITVTDANIVPPGASLTVHTPGKYESPTGYNVALTEYNEREYETYFFSYSSSKVYLGIGASYVTDNTTPRLPGFDGVANGDLTSTDNWLNINAAGFSGSNTSPAAEFAVSHSNNSTHYAQIKEGNDFIIKVQGYDQFSFGGRENGSGSGKQFVVTLNGVEQTISHSSTDWNLWRFDLNPATEYIIMVSGDGSNANRLRAFSLRLPAVAKHHVTYAYGDAGASGTLPTQTDVAEGATFTVASGAGLTPPEDKEFDKWNDGTTDYLAGATYTMGTSDVTLTAVWKEHETSDDATLSDLTVAGETVTGFDAATLEYNVELPFATSVVPTVAGTANSAFAKSVVVTPAASLPGSTKVVVTAEDNSTKTYTINFTVASSKVIDLVWKVNQSACEGAGSQAAVINSSNVAVSTYIKQISFENAEGTGDDAAEGASLNTGKKAGNVIIIQTKPGYLFTAMSFFGKIETADTKCQISVDGGVNWTDLASTSGGDALYCNVVSGASTSDIRIKGCGTAGTWIRNMQLTITTGCSPVTLAWSPDPATEVEVGKVASVSAVANNGTVSYVSDDADVIEVASNGALTVKALGSATITASVGGGDGTLYCSAAPSDINVTLNAYYLVEFDVQGGDAVLADVKYFSGDAALTEPSAGSLSGFDFEGWFDAATDGNAITWPLTPAASQKIYAHWTAQCAGPTITVQPEGANYIIGRTPAAISCTATAGNGGELNYAWYEADAVDAAGVALAGAPVISTAAAMDKYYYCIVTEEGCGVEVKSNVIHVVVAPKDGISIITATLSGESGKTATCTVTGLIGGTAAVNMSSMKSDGGAKLDNGKSFGITLAEGTFQAGDVVNVNVTTVAGQGTFAIWADNACSELIVDAGVVGVVGSNKVVLPASVAGKSTIYLARTDAVNNWNPQLNVFEVLRAMNPVLTAITIDGRVGEINEALKTVAVTIPYEADLAALTVVPTIVRNAAHPTTPVAVISNEGAWILGDNTYRIMDKDGDYTDYTITLDRDVLKHTVSFNTHGGSAVASEDVEHNAYLAAAPADPTKEDYIFQYWSLSDGGAAVDVTTVQINEDKEFHAVWVSDGAIKLLDGATVNHTNFITGVTADNTVEFMGNTVNYAKFSGTVSGVNGVKDLTRVIAYNATTNKTKIRISAHNNSTSARNILVKGLVEGADAAVDLATIALGNKEDVISDWIEFDNAANRTIYIMVSSSAGDVYFTQVKVIESGETPMKQFGEIGYSLNLNKGRFFGLASTDLAFEGLNARLSGDYTALNSGYAKLNATSMSFTLTAPALMTVTTNNSKTYYVTKGAAGTDNETALKGASEFNLTAGTWFITGGTEEVQITNIEFETPKSVTPVITAQPSSKVDFATSDPLTATVTVEAPSDEGTLSYQWYNAADNSEVTGANKATLTTTEPGTYYVIITNSQEGYQDALIQSDNATLKYRREDDASLIELTYGSEAIALVDGVYDYRVVLPEDATVVPALSATPTMSTHGATATITDATAFEEFEAVSSVLVTAEDEITTQTYTVTFVVKHPYAAIENVTGNTVWDWRGTVNQVIDDVANKGTVIANYIDGDNFEKIEGQEGAYARRTQNDGVYQGNYLHFNTTVAGKVKFYFRAPSSGDVCTITVKNGSRTVVAGSRGNSLGWSDEVYVTGDVVVEIKNVSGKDGSLTQGRIQQIIFTAVTPDYTRDLTEGRYGTICLPNGGIMVGAEIFEIAYYGETTKKIFLDNVPSGEMVAGRPYIFYPNQGVSQLAVFYTDEENASAGNHNGLFGFIGASADEYFNIPDGEGNYILQNNLYREVLAGAQARILSNRAYIKLGAINPSEPALAPGRRRISMGVQSEQVATGIGNVQGDEGQSTKVLINGQLFILRGEKMYDATGRLVK